MANLNLAMQEDKKNPDSKVLSSGQGIVLAIFFLIVAAYAGLVLYGKYIDNKAKQLQEGYAQEYEKFVGSQDSRKVLDFQDRLTIASKAYGEEKNVSLDFSGLEKSIINGVYVEKYSYDDKDKAIMLDLVAPDYGLVAQQIQGLKSSENFSLSQVGGSRLDGTKGKIFFSITLKANEPAKSSQQ